MLINDLMKKSYQNRNSHGGGYIVGISIKDTVITLSSLEDSVMTVSSMEIPMKKKIHFLYRIRAQMLRRHMAAKTKQVKICIRIEAT